MNVYLVDLQHLTSSLHRLKLSFLRLAIFNEHVQITNFFLIFAPETLSLQFYSDVSRQPCCQMEYTQWTLNLRFRML